MLINSSVALNSEIETADLNKNSIPCSDLLELEWYGEPTESEHR